jgi:hypothetical protein
MISINKKDQKGFSDWRAWPFYGLFVGLVLLLAPLLDGMFFSFLTVSLLAYPFVKYAAKKDTSYMDFANYDQVVQEWHDMFKLSKPLAQWRPVVAWHKARQNLTNAYKRATHLRPQKVSASSYSPNL